MSDLKLVAPDQATPLERLLLDAAAKEAPSAEQRMRVRQALGLPAQPLTPLPSTGQGARSLSFGKAAVGAVIVGSAALVAVLFALRHEPRPLKASAAAAAAPNASGNSVPERAPLPASPGPIAPSELPGSETVLLSAQPAASESRAVITVPPAAAPKPAAGARAIAADTGTDLGEQLRLIDAARTAIASGNASGAAQALAAYNAQFPRGSFGQEAAVLRIETVELQGNHAQAAVLAQRFLAAHPNSPHVGLVRRIAGN